MYTLYLLMHFITPNSSCIQQRWRNLCIKKFGKYHRRVIANLFSALIAMSSTAAVKLCSVGKKMSPKYLYF